MPCKAPKACRALLFPADLFFSCSAWYTAYPLKARRSGSNDTVKKNSGCGICYRARLSRSSRKSQSPKVTMPSASRLALMSSRPCISPSKWMGRGMPTPYSEILLHVTEIRSREKRRRKSTQWSLIATFRPQTGPGLHQTLFSPLMRTFAAVFTSSVPSGHLPLTIGEGSCAPVTGLNHIFPTLIFQHPSFRTTAV